MSKTFFFTIATLLLVILLPSKILAAVPDATTQNNYPTYLNLFDAPGSGLVIPDGGALVQDATTKSITGLKVNINVGFTSVDTNLVQARWDHIQNDTLTGNYSTNDSFIIRVCDTLSPTSCWLNNIPYYDKLDDSSGILNVLTSVKDGAVKQSALLSNLSILSSDSVGKKWKYTKVAGKNEGTISDFTSLVLPKGSTVEATMWYCADKVDGGEKDGSAAYANSPNNDNMATFGTLCGGDTYFRVGTPLQISIPTNDAAVQAQVNTQQATTTGSGITDNLPRCGILWGQSGTINGCAARIAYGIYWLTATIAGLLGKMFDFFLGYSLSDTSYRFAFAITGWKLVRDIANVFFIILMVWAGFSAVIDTNTGAMRKVVVNLIVNALLINFSLFATHVIIDLSNVTARMFYSQMIVCDQVNIVAGKCDAAHAKTGTGGYWPLSEKIVSAFNPQQLFQASILQSTPGTSSSSNQLNVNSQTVGTANPNSETDQANYFGIVCIVAAIIMVGVAIMFFKVTFLFVGRIVGLYICMIFSPFAFLSRDIPLLGGIAKLRWGDWVKEVTSYALMAPLFMFFLYIIYTFLSSDFAAQIGYKDPSGSFFALALGVAIPMIIIFLLLEQAQSTAESYAGDIGKKIQGWGSAATSMVAGAALGVATGGAALAGRNVVGRLGARLENSETLQGASAKGGILGWAADKTISRGSALSKNTFDLRNTEAGKNIQKRTGINLNNKLTSFVGAGTKNTDGGFKGAVSREEKTINERADRFRLSKAAEGAQNEKNKNWEKDYQTHRDAAESTAISNDTVFDELQTRRDYEEAQKNAKNARPKSAAEINLEREKQFKDSLEKRSVLSNPLAAVAEVVTNRFTAPTGAAGTASAAYGAATAATGAVLGGVGAVAAAAVVGQGAIQSAALKNVVLSRADKNKDALSSTQRTKAEAKLQNSQAELTKLGGKLKKIGEELGGFRGGAQHNVPYNKITSADILEYQNEKKVKIERIQAITVTKQNEMAHLQEGIDDDKEYIKNNAGNPAMAALVAAAQARIATKRADQNTIRTTIAENKNDESKLNKEMADARSALTEYNRTQSDIATIRGELKI